MTQWVSHTGILGDMTLYKHEHKHLAQSYIDCAPAVNTVA